MRKASLRKICERTVVSYGGVHASSVSKFKTTGLIKTTQRPGRPKTTTEAEDRKIIITSKQNRFKTDTKKPLFRPKNPKKRLQFAKDHLNCIQ